MIQQEHLISLAEAATRFPGIGATGRVSPPTVWRWCSRGVRLTDGSTLRLESLKIAGRFVTSIEAIERFISAQNPVVSESTSSESKPKQKKSLSRAEEFGRKLSESRSKN